MEQSKDITTEEKKAIRKQYGAMILAFILFFPTAIFVTNIFNGSFKYLFIPVSVPIYFVAISSIKNRISIIRPKGKKEPSRGKSAVRFGWILIVGLSIQLAFVLTPSLSNFRFGVGGKNPFQKPYDNLLIYQTGESAILFYQMEEPSDSNFTEINTYENISTWGGYKAVPLIVFDDMVLFIGKISEKEDPAIVADLINADIETGAVNWQALSAQGFIAVNADQVYVEIEPQSFGGATGIKSYDIYSGEKKWETIFDYKFAIGIHNLTLASDGVNIETYHRGKGAFYVLDQDSGKITTFTSEEDGIFTIENGTTYEWYGRSLEASGDYNWQTRFDISAYHYWELAAPVITDNLILVKNGYIDSSPVSAIRKSDGDIVWQFNQNVVSNIAVGGDITYFLTKETELFAVDTQTGSILGSVKFTPSFSEKYTPNFSQDHDFLNTSIYVAADDDIVAIYFEDTRQLSIFRFLMQ